MCRRNRVSPGSCKVHGATSQMIHLQSQNTTLHSSPNLASPVLHVSVNGTTIHPMTGAKDLKAFLHSLVNFTTCRQPILHLYQLQSPSQTRIFLSSPQHHPGASLYHFSHCLPTIHSPGSNQRPLLEIRIRPWPGSSIG